MSPDIMDLLRKRFGRTQYAPDDLMARSDALGRSIDETVDATHLPEIPEDGGGALAAEPVRKPLAMPAASTVSSPPEPAKASGLLGELSQDMTDAERSTLDDPRASAERQDSRNAFDRMSNVFLTSAGLPSQGQRDNPYVSERDKMRQWVMQRGQVARGNDAAGLQADRTRAYLEATQAGRERDLAAQQLRAEQEGRKADAEEYKRKRQELLDERDQANRDREFRLKEEAERKKRDKSKAPTGRAGAPKGFPAGWELDGKTSPTPKQGEQFEGLVFSSEKMKGLTAQMREMLREAGNGRVIPGATKSRMAQLAKEIQIEGKNVAELGALSGPDYALMEAIAADPTKLDSFAKDMPALLDGLDRWGDNSVGAKARSLGARRIGSVDVPKEKAPPPSGRVVVVKGSEKLEIDAADLPAAEKDGYRRAP